MATDTATLFNSRHKKIKIFKLPFIKKVACCAFILLLGYSANAQLCATAGQDGPTNTGTSINTYYPPTANITLPAGSKTIILSAVPATDTYGNNFGTTQISPGDLLMIIQMQDATINFSNTTLYGGNNSSSGPDGLGATGYTNIGNAGKFEYLVATSSVPLTGGTLTFKGAGVGNGSINTYTNADPSGIMGKRSFQVIRITQYSNLRLSSNISPPPFNGVAGGIIAFDVAGTMDFNGFKIDVSGKGFRGGYSLVKNSVGNITDLYVTTSADQRASGKGEGIAGTPRYMWDGYNQVDNIIEGLPAGSDGRGAPANAGGGGNDSNSGGGGGGNGGYGGNGGWGYEPIGGTNPAGGRPGSVVFTAAQPLDVTRIIMGGGGGGGHANDALTGVKGGVGGGIVVINAATIIGNGTILANGGNGAPGVYGSHPDGSGGGAAGGSVLIKVSNPNPSAIITIHAIGGLGGNTQGDDPNVNGVQPHGPGGGGGGGVIWYAIASGTINSDVSPGASGKTNSGAGITHFATDGKAGVAQSFIAASLPSYLQGQGSVCYPSLVTTMTEANPAATKTSGSTATYTITITNSASSGNAGGVRADCLLPNGFSFQSATVAYSGSAGGPATLVNSGTAVRPLLGDFNISPGDAVTITLIAAIDCGTLSGTYNASVQAIYLDPTRTFVDPTHRITALINAFPGSNTSYQSNSLLTVPGSNYDGTASANENVIVINNSTAISNNTIAQQNPNGILCTPNADPSLITGSTPSGGTGTYTYQWQNSTDNITFTDIPAAASKDYDPPVINVTTYYRRTVSSGACTPPLASNVITIQVLSPVTNNALSAPAATIFCASGDPAVITGSTPSGANGTYTYQWQGSTDNSTFTDISGATAKDYDPPVLTVTTYYRRVITSAACAIPPLSNVVSITIQPALSNNVITAPAVISFCGSGDAAIITGSSALGGNGTYTYQWQSSADNVTFADISGATSQSYDPPLLSATTYYRRTVISGTCLTPLLSNVVTITITSIPATPVPVLATVNICYNNSAVLAVSAPVTGVAYNWYNSPSKTTLLFTGANYTTPALTTNATYYVEAANGTCTSPAMASVLVNVSALVAVPALVSNNITTCSGTTATLSISAPQAGITYNWYTAATGGSLVFTGTSYVISGISANATYYAEAANAAGCTSATRTAGVINVNQTPVAPQVSAVGICPGSTATLTATNSDPTVTISWYAAPSGGTAIATGNTYTTPILNANATFYAQSTTNTGCTSTSRTTASVQMLQQLPAPVVTVGDVTSTSITFQWSAITGATGYLVSLDNGLTFVTPSSGSAGLLHKITGLQPGQSVSIIARATGASCQLSSNSVTVTTIARNPLGSPIYVPNVFTPNNDGNNDILYVYGIDIKSLNLYVYSQWGELLFQSNNQANGWDGTYKGAREPVGVYVYYLTVVTNNGEKVSKKGTITLVR